MRAFGESLSREKAPQRASIRIVEKVAILQQKMVKFIFSWTKLVKFIPFLKVFGILKTFFQKGLKRVKGRALAHSLSPINCNFIH